MSQVIVLIMSSTSDSAPLNPGPSASSSDPISLESTTSLSQNSSTSTAPKTRAGIKRRRKIVSKSSANPSSLSTLTSSGSTATSTGAYSSNSTSLSSSTQIPDSLNKYSDDDDDDFFILNKDIPDHELEEFTFDPNFDITKKETETLQGSSSPSTNSSNTTAKPENSITQQNTNSRSTALVPESQDTVTTRQQRRVLTIEVSDDDDDDSLSTAINAPDSKRQKSASAAESSDITSTSLQSILPRSSVTPSRSEPLSSPSISSNHQFPPNRPSDISKQSPPLANPSHSSLSPSSSPYTAVSIASSNDATKSSASPGVSKLEMFRKLLEERRSQERKERAEKDNTSSFNVGIVIRTCIESLEAMPPISVVIDSNDLIRDAFQQYFEKVNKLCANFPESETVFVWKNERIFATSTPNHLGVVRSAPTMPIAAYVKQQFDEKVRQEQDEKQKGLDALDVEKLSEAMLNEAMLEKQKQELSAGQQGGANGSRSGSVGGNGTPNGNNNSKSMSPANGEADNSHFPIVLKGKDNKPITVKVSATTPIEKIAKYYLAQKQLDESLYSKVRLVFDDEDIDLSGTVGDTELEAEFSVDVYVD